jgi:predicted MFS family arabinose efflux permease
VDRPAGFWDPLRIHDVRLLIAGLGLSQIGDWLYNVALIVFVLERTGSAAWVAAAGIIRLLPYVVFGPIGGWIADHRPRRATMVTSDLIRCAAMLVLAVVTARDGAPAVALALAAIATVFSVAYSPCVNAAIPRMVSEDDLSAVNTLSATVTNLSYALGPALGGLMLIIGSPSAAFVVNGVTFLSSAVLTLLIRTDLGPDIEAAQPVATPTEEPATGSGSMAGFRVLSSSPFVLALVLTQVATCVLYGLETVLYALVTTARLGMSVDGVAFLYAAIGVGGLTAAGVARRLADRSEAGVVLATAAVLCGVPMATIAVLTLPSAALAVLLIEGAAMIVVDVMVATSLQRVLGADLLGRAFGALDALIVAGMLFGMLVAPIVVSTFGLTTALVLGGALMLLAGTAVWSQRRAIDASVAAYSGPLQDRVAVLRRLSIFRGASRATLEHLAEALTEEDIDADVSVIRQGDEPDDLFVVVRGELRVTVATPDGSDREVGELGLGDYFGEVGLLRRVARTATVRTVVPCHLYRVPGDEFLDIVSQGSVRSRTLARTTRARVASVSPVEGPAD